MPIPHGTEGLVESCWLLLTSVVAVPLVCMVPGGSAVLGFLVRLPRLASKPRQHAMYAPMHWFETVLLSAAL